jgi:RNA polymerase sigma factor (sigma-70 family)
VGELYKRYSTLAYGTCMKYLKDPDLARDASMDVFEKLVNDLPRYQIQSFKSWLYMVLKNHCLQILRNTQNHISIENIYDGDMEIAPQQTLDSEYNTEQQLQLMEKAIDELEAGQKQCLKMFYLDKMTYAQIEKQTGYSYNEVKSFIQNGKRNLKMKMLKLMVTMVLLISVFFYK